MAQAAPKTGRNDPCSCGSGKKFKHCCDRERVRRERVRDSVGRGLFLLLGPAVLILLGVIAIAALRDGSDGPAQRVWSTAHNHWHLRGPDGSEVEARPGIVWSEEEKRFVQAKPITGAARKHVTADIDHRVESIEEQLLDSAVPEAAPDEPAAE
jgi:hypothetical protein